MTSPAQILASRRNGRAGTGPGSAAGKARASRNARRHGFTLPVAAEPALAREVVDVADDIVRSVGARAGDPATHALACRIAEAMIDLRRIRLAKLPLLAALHAAPTRTRRTLRALARLDRYERHALWRRKTALRAFAESVARIERSEVRGDRPGLRFAQSGLQDDAVAESGTAEQNEPENANDINNPPHPSTTSGQGCVPPRDPVGSRSTHHQPTKHPTES